MQVHVLPGGARHLLQDALVRLPKEVEGSEGGPQ